jgi:glucokinase
MEQSIVLGAVVEDSLISAGLVDLETRKILSNPVHRIKFNPAGTMEEILDTILTLFKRLSVGFPPRTLKVGFGLLGPCNYDTGVFLGNNNKRLGSLHNINIKTAISNELLIPTSSIRLLNDSICFLRGEVFGGAVRNYRRSIGISLGMGLGSAIFAEGQVRDANLWSSPFKFGIVEDLLSSKWIVTRYNELANSTVNSILEMKAQNDTHLIQEVFKEFSDNLSDFLADLIKAEHPEAVIIGGHMQASNRLFFNRTVENLELRGITTPIVRTYLGEVAAVVGAASIWYSEK